MFSSKQNILQTVALLKAYGVKEIVLSPGSRNAPIIQTFTQDSFFNCHIVVDERNAAFWGIGIIQAKKEAVAICCTSGSAMLNYAPAISEAFYQQLPLIVISADRSEEWIGQMDGQTMHQVNTFGTIVKKSVNLPEINNDTDEWYCNRLLNEALTTCLSPNKGPVHINIPIGEPLFDYSITKLPQARKIKKPLVNKNIDLSAYKAKWNDSTKKIIVVGQMFYSEQTVSILEQFADKHNCVILTEYLSNCNSSKFISNFDLLLGSLQEEKRENYRPEILITIGGHIVSKKLKHFFRKHKPLHHWLIDESGEIVDLFQSLTDVVEMNPLNFLEEFDKLLVSAKDNEYLSEWKKLSNKIQEPSESINFSDIWTTGYFLRKIPQDSLLHVANSNAIRNIQLFNIDKSVQVYCNRGINGIESTLPTTVGFASVVSKNVYLIIGDLSFFYGLNSLWNIKQIKNLRILLINNNGGGIFHLLPGLNKSESLDEYVSAGHSSNAELWTKSAGFKYMNAKNKSEVENQIAQFISDRISESIVFEVNVDTEISNNVLYEYVKNINNK